MTETTESRIEQYYRARAEHPGVLLLVRVGDFYEAYDSDAVTIAGAIGLVLTGRSDGNRRVPMVVLPYHSVERRIASLVKMGLRVAILDGSHAEEQGLQP